MGNRKSRERNNIEPEKEFDVFVCRNGTVFSAEYNEWLEFVDTDDEKSVIVHRNFFRDSESKSVENNPTIRIYAGRVVESDLPLVGDLDLNVFDILKGMKLRSKYEVYVCRKISLDQNYHIWIEIVNTHRPFNDVVHKFHMQVKQDENEKRFVPPTSPQMCLQKVKMRKSPKKYIYADQHKRLFPPGEFDACKVAIGYTDLTINDISYLSQTIGGKLSSMKRPDLLSTNCRTYVLRLCQCLSLPMGEKAMSQLSANWGTGRGQEEIWDGIGMGAKVGVLLGSGICLTCVGVCWTSVIGTIGFLNPAKVGEVVGIGMIVTGGILVIGGVSSLAVGGVCGGMIGSLVGGLRANINDRGFESADGENVIIIKRPSLVEGDINL